jgi:hypothetical protein
MDELIIFATGVFMGVAFMKLLEWECKARRNRGN